MLEKTQIPLLALPGQIILHNLAKTYVSSAGEFTAIREVNLTVSPGEFIAVVGKSGSGKSTLLNLVAGIDRPTAGEVCVSGTALQSMTEDQIATWRGNNVGVVFQFFQLLPTLTIMENIMLPMDFCGRLPVRQREGRARELLDMVGIADQAGKLPASISGGEQQRAAIARSLANDPLVVVADEPTGNLDSRNAEQVLQLFRKMADSGKTVLVVTHEREIAQYCSRIIKLADGQIVNGNTGISRSAQVQEVGHDAID